MQIHFKRVLAVLLVISLLWSSLPFPAFSEEIDPADSATTETTGPTEAESAITEATESESATTEPCEPTESEPATTETTGSASQATDPMEPTGVESATTEATEPSGTEAATTEPSEPIKSKTAKSIARTAALSSGITLEMVSDAALVNMSVRFKVTAPGADTYTVSWYDGNRTFIESVEESLTDGVGTFNSWVNIPSTEIIEVSAVIDGVTYTDEMRVDYTSLGKSPSVPTITSTENPLLRQPYTLTWSAVEGASDYYLYLENPAGQVAEGRVDGNAYTMPENQFSRLGNYTFRIAAIQEGYERGDFAEQVFHVSKIKADSRVSIQADPAEVLLGDSMNISVQAPGAEQVNLYSAKLGYGWAGAGESDAWSFDYRETHIFYGAALYDGTWVYSDLLTVPVTSLGQLAVPVLSAPATVAAGQEMTVTWEAVENAEYYDVIICNAQGDLIDEEYGISNTAVTFSAVYDAGTYTVVVTARSNSGWVDSRSTASFAVTGELAPAPTVTVAGTNLMMGDQIQVEVQAPGASKIRARWSDWGDYEYPVSDGVASFQRIAGYEGTITLSVRALVDGSWTKWSLPIEITMSSAGQLDAPVITVPDTIAAGQPLTVSWEAVEHANQYFVEIMDADDQSVEYDWVEETAYVSKSVLRAGTYTVRVAAQSETHTQAEAMKQFAVSGELAEGPSFTMDKDQVVAGKTVTFTVSMEGATSFRLSYGTTVKEIAAENGTATYAYTVYGTPGDVVEVKISACVNGIWTAYGPVQRITILDKPTLPKTVVTIPEDVHAGDDIVLTWTAVENAQNYTVLMWDSLGETAWSGYVSGTETSITIPAGRVKQGAYLVELTASGSGYYSSEADPVELTVLAPLPGREFRYGTSYDNSEVYLYEYLGDPVPSEIVIPDSIDGIPVTDISSNCFENAGTLTKVTIPASVTYISNTAFRNAENLTICGYTGSTAENFAIVNGYAFSALDDGEGDISASWPEEVLVNAETTFTVLAPGATEVRMYRNGSKGYGTVTLTETGANVIWKPTEVTTYSIRFEALVDGQWLTTKNYPVQITSYGPMPKVTDLKVTSDIFEPCSDISISWTAPAGVEAAEYTAGIQKPSASIPTRFSIRDGETSHTFSGYWATEEGPYILSVEVRPQPGYEPSVTSITLELKSTRLWDYLASYKRVVAYHGTDKDVTIPAEIEGQPVTRVGDRIFEGSELTSVTVSEGIETIETSAFQSSELLQSVALSSTLESIGAYAFAGCEKLTEINLPASLETIREYAFSGCFNLTSITIPEKIKTLEYNTFYSCSSLSQVTLPDSLTTIQHYAFGFCTGLKSITIPQSVSSISDYAFYGCTGLTIYGYEGSEAERFAEAQGFEFVALDGGETGEISFELRSNTVYRYGYIYVTVEAPDAEKVRLHVDDETQEYNVYNGKASMYHYASTTGDHSVTVSQCVDGQWLMPCEKQTVTVVALDVPEIEPITTVPVSTALTVRWKPVDGATYYRLELSEENVQLKKYDNITAVDEAGYVYQQLSAADTAKGGIITMKLWAYAADGGYSYSERSFEVADPSDAFVYEVNEDGNAVITAFAGSGETAVVPAQLDGYAVVEIAAQTFRNCTELKSISIADAQLVIEAGAIVDCPALMSITLGPGVFVEHGAFGDCRTDMTVYGYSGGNVEEEALASCKFFALGELAAGPVVAAEDIWNNESLRYSVTGEGASALYVVEVYPSGYTNRYTHFGSTVETKSNISFVYETEDLVVYLKCAALVNGVWTAYTQKEVAVSVAKYLEPAVIPEIGSLARHQEHVISWEPVEHAESYDVLIFNNSDLMSWTVDAPATSVTVAAGALEEDAASSISVTAKARGYFESNATAEFQVYSMKLDTPKVTVEERIPRHLGATISWSAVEHAEWYTVSVTNQDGTYSLCEEKRVEGNSLQFEADGLKPDDYVISVRAHASYCADSDPGQAVFEVYEQQLETPEIDIEDRIARHLGAEIRWEAVADAEWYTVTVVSEDGERQLCQNKQVSDTVFKLYPSELEPDVYKVAVTAHAAYFADSKPGDAEFEVYLAPLDPPVVTAADTIVGGIAYDVQWQQVADAVNYQVQLFDGDGKELYNAYAYEVYGELLRTVLLDEYLLEDNLTLRVTARANYRTDGVTEKEIQYKPLYSYEVVDGSAVITGYNGQDTRLWIPGTINDYPVSAIGDSAFEGNAEIIAAYLPDSAVEIGNKAFKNCTALETVIGDGVKKIGDEAFYNCVSLRIVEFCKDGVGAVAGRNSFFRTPIAEDPDLDGLLDITVTQSQESTSPGSYAGNLFINKITYQEGFTDIPDRAHYNNLRLQEVYLPRSLKTIGSEAFAECPWLDYVQLYDGVEDIAEDAFANSESVHLYIYTSAMGQVSYVEQYAIDHDIPYTKVFSYEPPAVEEEKPDTVSYAEGTFGIPEKDQYENERLTSVSMPETVEFVGSKAFAQCGALTTVELYDSIASIAEDAFEGSPNVEFVLYVTDPEQVSYAEQYAIDHGIPYRKVVKLPEAEDQIDLGDNVAEPVRVKVDVPADITVSDIPAEADRLTVYLDGQAIREMTLDQVSAVTFTHTFRDLGEHVLTAEAYADAEVIKYSWSKPVIVTGIRLMADRSAAWVGEKVTFAVEAYPEEAHIQLYAENYLLAEVALTDGAATYTYAFTETGNREITARTYSGLRSEPLRLPIQCIGVLDQPVLEAESIQFLEDGLVCSWNTTQNTDGYVLRVRMANGEEVTSRNLEDDGSGRMSCTIPKEELRGAGSYVLYLMNYGYQYSQNESATVIVQMTEDATPVFTMDKNTVLTGETVNFTFCAFGAIEVELWVDGEAIESIPLVNYRAEFARAFTQSGAREVAIRARTQEGWTDLTEIQILQVSSNGKLEDVVVTADPIQLLGNEIAVSWNAVENADGYTVYFRTPAHETLWKQTVQQLSVNIPAEATTEIGDYYVMVVAYGSGYDQSQGSVQISVLNSLPGPVILTPGENEACVNTDVELTWQEVAGAESYVVSLARKTEQTGANGESIYEKVWDAPNETVNVGTALSFDLTGLVYGQEYRVAVGTVAQLDDGTQRIGWTERLFSVKMPELTVTLSSDTVSPNEGDQITLTAVVNHPMTDAVLTDETGTVVTTLSSGSEVVNNSRVFTFVVTAAEQGEKTYTVTVSGVDELADVQSVTANLSVKWIDPDAAAIDGVVMEPASVIAGKTVTFKITANAKTERIEVYTETPVAGSTPVETLQQTTSADGKVTFLYTTQFENAGEVTLVFVPCNDMGEKGENITEAFIVMPKGMLPAPTITNLAMNAVIPSWGYTVKWDPVVLDPGETHGGYSVTLYTVGSSGNWEAVTGHYNVFVGTECAYEIPAMDAGKWYRMEVYTVPAGMTQPVLNISGCGVVEFRMENPAVSIVANGVAPNTWVMIGDTVRIKVTANKLVEDIRLYDGNTLIDLKIDKDTSSADANVFTVSYQAAGEGLHVIKAVDTNTKSKAAGTVNVYVVKPEDEVPMQCKPGTTTKGWIIPREGYSENKAVTITENTKLIRRGTCGEFILVRVNDGDSFFVHETALDIATGDIQIIYPTPTDTIVLEETPEFVVRWTSVPDAKSYDVKLTTHYVNRQGKESSVVVLTKTVNATSDLEQTLPVDSSVIISKVKPLSSMINTDWVTEIEITANS